MFTIAACETWNKAFSCFIRLLNWLPTDKNNCCVGVSLVAIGQRTKPRTNLVAIHDWPVLITLWQKNQGLTTLAWASAGSDALHRAGWLSEQNRNVDRPASPAWMLFRLLQIDVFASPRSIWRKFLGLSTALCIASLAFAQTTPYRLNIAFFRALKSHLIDLVQYQHVTSNQSMVMTNCRHKTSYLITFSGDSLVNIQRATSVVTDQYKN